MEIFDEAVTLSKLEKFGVVLVKITNYDSLISIVNAHERVTIDQLIVGQLLKIGVAYSIGKVSSDSFEIITENTYMDDEIHDIIEQIKEVLNHQSFYDHDMNVYNLDFRVGVAIYPEDGMNQRELLRKATIAVAKASTGEKGCVQFYNDHIRDELASKMQLEYKLREGLSGDQLYLEFQPQFNVKDHKIRGFEALVRWKLPDGTIMMPNEFISLAENMGIIDELGEWVLKNALLQGCKWNVENHKDWMLSVNVSIGQLEQEGFADSVIHSVKESGYPVRLLELEVTETKMASSSDRVFLELSKLRKFGIKIAIDDFGTGYSSLDYLSVLPFDILKIDKGFIERIHENEADVKIMESIIELAEKMEFESIAEGVETKEQLDFLKETKLNYIQGFVFSKPMSTDAVMDLVDESSEE
jgi:EAL domain-containing protein (putative c-di-GMP-specific phosphodiesterase class I)/GGDEF domain-containing protein